MKVPRFAFEKFPGADPTLTTHMKSVGEAMAIGRNFTEALQKALRSLESKDAVFDWRHEWVDARQGRRCSRRSGRRTTAGCKQGHGRDPRRRHRRRRSSRPPGSTRGSSTSCCLINEVAAEVAAADRADPATAAPGQAARLLRRPDRQDPRACARTSSAASGTRSGSGRSTRPSTPAPPSSPRATPYHYSSYDEETEVAPARAGRR